MQDVLILRCRRCTYVSHVGPWGVLSASYASAARVSRGYMFARVSHGYMVYARACVAWLHGLRDGQRPPQGTNETSSAKTHVPHVGT